MLSGCGATTNWGNPWTGAGGKVLAGRDHPMSHCCVSIRNVTQPWLHTGAPGSCFLPAQQEGRSFLLWPGHLPEPAHCHRHTLICHGERVGWLLWVTVVIYSVNLQYRAVTVHFSVSLMFFLSIQFWLLFPGKCCAGWVLLTWERSHCYNGSIKIAAISRICPDCT